VLEENNFKHNQWHNNSFQKWLADLFIAALIHQHINLQIRCQIVDYLATSQQQTKFFYVKFLILVKKNY
jgi:hypothetical protein